jgi:hypothetical protein
MKKTINQLRVELNEIATKHGQINSFAWKDFLRAYTEEELNYPLMCAYYPSGSLSLNQTEISLTVIIADKIYKDWEINLNEVESDTLQICRDVFNIINQSDRWQRIGRVTSCSVSKFIERGGDEVAGHTMTINFLIRDNSGVCDIPIFDYDFDQEISVGCSPVNVFNSDSSYTQEVASGDSLELPDITYAVKNSAGTTLAGATLPSVTNIDTTLSDVDNIDSDGSTVPTPAGVPFTCTPSGVCADATVTLNSITMDTIPSGDTENIQVLQSDDITEVGSKQGVHWRIDDSVITLNSGAFLSVKAEDSQDIELVDQDDTPIVPDSVVGNKITVTVGGGSSVGATLMKTGQTTSYRTGDDGDLEQGRELNFFNLDSNNTFGNLKRFTGITGGYQDETDSLFYDKDGISTTEALALPSDIVIDWSTNGLPSDKVLGYKRTPQTSGTWNNIIDNNTGITHATFTNWNVWNLRQYTNIVSIGNASTNQFSIPFTALNSESYMWNSSTDAGNTSNAWLITKEPGQYYRTFSKVGTSQKTVIVRTFTVTGTTLS